MNMRNTTSIDFRTPKERERDQRNKLSAILMRSLKPSSEP